MVKDRLLILGVGNWLMGDEGVGVHAARRAEELPWPPGTRILDGGTGGFHLMEYLENADRVILIDATLDDRPAGSFRHLTPRFASDYPRSLSSHDIGLRDLLEGLAILDRMPEVHLFAVSAASVQDQCIELSEPLEAAMPALLQAVQDLAHLLAERPLTPAGGSSDPSGEGRPFIRHTVTTLREHGD